MKRMKEINFYPQLPETDIEDDEDRLRDWNKKITKVRVYSATGDQTVVLGSVGVPNVNLTDFKKNPDAYKGISTGLSISKEKFVLIKSTDGGNTPVAAYTISNDHAFELIIRLEVERRKSLLKKFKKYLKKEIKKHVENMLKLLSN